MAVEVMSMPRDSASLNGGVLPSHQSHSGKSSPQHSSKPPSSNDEFTGDLKVTQKLPTKAELDDCADLPILTPKGVSVPFKNLYTNDSGTKTRVLIVFIRHFFCGNCQEYLRTLCSSITPTDLSALPIPTSLAIIGCGDPSLIAFYATTTSCPFPIYADPSKKLYSILGMARTLHLGDRPEYIQTSLLTVMIRSFYQSLGQGRKALKGGDYWQVGGEFLIEEGAVVRVHRMRNTRDHAEVPVLRKWVGLDEEEIPRRKRWSLGLLETGGGIKRSLSRRRESWSRSRSRNGRREGSLGSGSGSGSGMGKVREEGEEGVVKGEGLVVPETKGVEERAEEKIEVKKA